MSDALFDGRRLRLLPVRGHFTHACLDNPFELVESIVKGLCRAIRAVAARANSINYCPLPVRCGDQPQAAALGLPRLQPVLAQLAIQGVMADAEGVGGAADIPAVVFELLLQY
nr:hypothetical protein [Xanthomonas vasicola]